MYSFKFMSEESSENILKTYLIDKLIEYDFSLGTNHF